MTLVEYERLNNVEVNIPKIGLGTYQIELSPRDEAISALRRGIELGMTLIDTAEMYGWGRSEEIVGEAIKPFDREELTIVTKVWGTNLAYESVKKSAKASIARLDTYIDIYLIHWPNPSYPLEETLKAMEELVSEGIIRYIGVSNFSLGLLKEARNLLRNNDIVTNQVEYSLRVRNPEADILPYCQRERITLMAYSPLDRGRIIKRPPQKLKVIAARLGKSVAQIAINWLISKPMVVAIPKASKVEHVEENAGAAGWRIPQDLMAELEELEEERARWPRS